MKNLILGPAFIVLGIVFITIVIRRYPQNKATRDLTMIVMSLIFFFMGVMILLLEAEVIDKDFN
jgi:hypothetical protein